MKKCKNCEAILPDTAKFCNVCGTDLTDSANYTEVNEDGSEVGSGSEEKLKFKKCNQCGKLVPADAKFCRGCGADLRNAENYTLVEEENTSSEKEEKEQEPEEQGHLVKKCNQCGNIVSDNAKFCNVCGADMRNSANYTMVDETKDEPVKEEPEKTEEPVSQEEEPVTPEEDSDEPIEMAPLTQENAESSEEKPEEPVNQAKKCKICGSIVAEDAKFCNVCGADMRDPANYTLIGEKAEETAETSEDHKDVKPVVATCEADHMEKPVVTPEAEETTEEPVEKEEPSSDESEQNPETSENDAEQATEPETTPESEEAVTPETTDSSESEDSTATEDTQPVEISEEDTEQADEAAESVPADGPEEKQDEPEQSPEPADEENKSEETTEQPAVPEEKESSGTKIKKCKNCGNIVSDTAKFCNVCGADMNNPANYVLEEETPAASVAPEQSTETSDQETKSEETTEQTAVPEENESSGTKIKKCKNYGNIVSDTAKFCNVCGADMNNPANYVLEEEAPAAPVRKVKKCNQCGSIVSDNAKFCNVCGADMSNPANYTLVDEAQPAPVRQVKKCNRCGAIIKDDSVKFCNNCGNDMQNPANYTMVDEPKGDIDTEQIKQAVTDAGAAASAAVNKAVQNDKVQKFLQNKKAVAGVIIAVVAVVVLIIVHAVMPKTIDLSKYTTIDVTGYDGYGTAEVKIDEKRLAQDITAAAIKKKTGMYLSELDDLDLDYNLSQSNNLSNDDTVTLTWNVSKDALSNMKIKLNTKDITKKVSDLKKAKTFDAFKDIKVQVTGAAPFGEAKLNKTSDNDLTYKLSKSTGLSNGDKIKVTVSSSFSDDKNFMQYVKEHGKMPEKTTRTYEVSDLDEYVTSADDLTDDAIKKMTSQAEDVIKAHDVNELSDDVTLNSLTYQGLYFLKAKDRKDDDDDDYYDDAYNKVYIVELQTFTDTDYDGNQKTVKAYTAVEFNSISKAKDGTINVDLSDYSTVDSSFLPDDDYDYSYVYGYESQDDLYEDCVTSQADMYTSETKAAK